MCRHVSKASGGQELRNEFHAFFDTKECKVVMVHVFILSAARSRKIFEIGAAEGRVVNP